MTRRVSGISPELSWTDEEGRADASIVVAMPRAATYCSLYLVVTHM